MLRNKVKSLLESKGVSTYQAGKAIFGRHTALYRYINDPQRIPPHTEMSKLCAHFNVQPQDIIEFVPNAG